MFDKVKSIIAEQLDMDENKITPDTKLIEDLGADSLDVVELIMAFSDEFGIEIPDEASEKISTVSDIVNYLKANA